MSKEDDKDFKFQGVLDEAKLRTMNALLDDNDPKMLARKMMMDLTIILMEGRSTDIKEKLRKHAEDTAILSVLSIDFKEELYICMAAVKAGVSPQQDAV